MAIWDSIIRKFSERIASDLYSMGAADAQTESILAARAYRSGYYRPQLRVKMGQFDDNVGLNFTGLIAARIIGQMFGNGIELDFEGETETPGEQHVKAVLDANKQELLFHRAVLSAVEAGTGYMMIIPDGVIGADGSTYPRLQLIDPLFVTMDTVPEDYEVVTRYTIQYKFTGADGKERARRRVIERGEGQGWTVTDYEQATGTRWEMVNQADWGYDFAPIIHWQNLPSVASCYGEPDITESLIALNDRLNLVGSNISKIVRLYAHPMRYGVNIGDMKAVDVGPDQMLRISGDNAAIVQLEALGDLASSMQFLTMLRQAFFDTARTVDIDSIGDKLGALTNFGLRVLYQDNLTMIGTHRELFGDMLEELARRLLILNGMQPLECKVVWPDFLPTNTAEEMQSLEGDLRMEIVSKQTVAAKRGYDWEQELERMDLEAQIGYEREPDQ